MYVVGLFKPLSYQDRAVQLAYNNRTSICYEPFRPLSTSDEQQDGEWCGPQYINIDDEYDSV